MKKIILIFILFTSLSATDEFTDKYNMDHDKMIKYYDKMFNIVCYVWAGEGCSDSKQMQCFDLDVDRLKLKATGKKKEEKEKEKVICDEEDY
jgi:hypothetical protein